MTKASPGMANVGAGLPRMHSYSVSDLMLESVSYSVLAMETAFRDLEPQRALRALLEAVLLAPVHGSAGTLAQACGCAPRTLRRDLAAAGLPTPRATIAWAKVVVAGDLLRRSGRTVESVAAELGMDGASQLVHVCRRYAGATPSEIRVGGGGSFAIRLLLWRFREKRNRGSCFLL